VFKTFPEFSKLTLADKDEYEALVKDYPPCADLEFCGLLTWWDTGHTSISLLNGNIVLSYWLPGDEKNSGLAFIGTNDVDESMCAIFDYLREKGEKPRIVNIPDFVMANISYPEMFNCKSQRCHDEYLLDTSNYYPLNNMPAVWRSKVKRKIAGLDETKFELKNLDLSKPQNRYLLLTSLVDWQAKNVNNLGKHEEACVKAIMHASQLGLDNVCMFVDGHLYGFCLYNRANDRQLTSLYIKATNNRTVGYAIMLYILAKWAQEQGFETANICSDCGVLQLRMFMLTLGPVNFYRKYSIEPANT